MNFIKATLWVFAIMAGNMLLPLIALVIASILTVLGIFGSIYIIKVIYDLEREGAVNDEN